MLGVPLAHPGSEFSLIPHFCSEHFRMLACQWLRWASLKSDIHPRRCALGNLGQGKEAWEGPLGLEKAASGLWWGRMESVCGGQSGGASPGKGARGGGWAKPGRL